MTIALTLLGILLAAPALMFWLTFVLTRIRAWQKGDQRFDAADVALFYMCLSLSIPGSIGISIICGLYLS